jgi:hypothetical protein
MEGKFTRGCRAVCKPDQVGEVSKAYAKANLFEWAPAKGGLEYTSSAVPTVEDCALICKNKLYDLENTHTPYGGQCIGFHCRSGFCELLFRENNQSLMSFGQSTMTQLFPSTAPLQIPSTTASQPACDHDTVHAIEKEASKARSLTLRLLHIDH